LRIAISKPSWRLTSGFNSNEPKNMRLTILTVFFAAAGLSVISAHADIFENLGLKKPSIPSAAFSELSQDQIVAGLKEALAKGVSHAVTNLGQTNGFLNDVKVRIPLPESLVKVENGLRAVGQERLADEFVTTMNHAAEQAVPEAASVLADSVRQMTVSDARTILGGADTAATDYFRRAAETNLFLRFLPIVKKATSQAGVTASYKKMTEKIGGGTLDSLGELGGFAGKILNQDALDIDSYITKKALDGLFVKIAEQEKLIRQNPAARTTEILQKVFGSVRGARE
jgi:hypothetical protein